MGNGRMSSIFQDRLLLMASTRITASVFTRLLTSRVCLRNNHTYAKLFCLSGSKFFFRMSSDCHKNARNVVMMSRSFSDMKGVDFEAMLVVDGLGKSDIKRCYIKLAKEYHPDTHSGDPTAGDKFIRLGRAYEKVMKKLEDGKLGSNALEEHEDDEEDEYGEEEVSRVCMFTVLFVDYRTPGAGYIFSGRRSDPHARDEARAEEGKPGDVQWRGAGRWLVLICAAIRK